jgi:hypothetical protein
MISKIYLLSVSVILFFAFANAQSDYGCVDSEACNYDMSALFDDGSCIYPNPEDGFANFIIDDYDFTFTNVSGDYSFYESGEGNLVPGTSVYVQGSNMFSQGTNLMFFIFNQGSNMNTALSSQIYEYVIDAISYADDNIEEFECYGFQSEVSINEHDFNNFLTVYPNPAKDIIYLNLDSKHDVEVYVTNTMGQRVQNYTTSYEDGSRLMINISSLKSGIYAIEVVDGIDRYTSQFIVHE